MSGGLAVAVAILATCVVPIVLSRMNARQRLAERKADWKRQDEVAARLLDADGETKAQLGEIHTLVNSNMTSEMQRALGFAKALLVSLKGGAKTEEDAGVIKALEEQIAEMEAALHDRLTNT